MPPSGAPYTSDFGLSVNIDAFTYFSARAGAASGAASGVFDAHIDRSVNSFLSSSFNGCSPCKVLMEKSVCRTLPYCWMSSHTERLPVSQMVKLLNLRVRLSHALKLLIVADVKSL